MEEQDTTIDLLQLYVLLKANFVWLLVSTLLCATVGGLITVFLITPQYEAQATMIVNTREDQTATVTNDQITSARNLVSTYAIIITSDTVLNQVKENLNLEEDYETLSSKIVVTAVDNTAVMKIAMENADPAKGKAIIGEIVKVAPDIILEMVEAGSVRVISEARVSKDPVSPNEPLNIAIAGLIGLCFSTVIIVLREMLNNTFKTDDDIQKHLGLLVLGVVPQVTS